MTRGNMLGSAWIAVAASFGAASLGAAAPAPADLDSAAVVARLQSWLDGTKDLKCRFEQRIVSGALGPGEAERGTLALLRPGRMRWDYESPEKKLALVNGVTTFVYLPADRQVVRGRIDGEGGAFGQLLTGQARVSELFAPLLVGSPREGGSRSYRLRLSPRTESQGLEAVVLQLRPPEFSIEGAEVVDPAGNVIEYRFESLRRNRGVPAEIFQFEPPAGTEIIDAGGA